jgi:hypothetical protein
MNGEQMRSAPPDTSPRLRVGAPRDTFCVLPDDYPVPGGSESASATLRVAALEHRESVAAFGRVVAPLQRDCVSSPTRG